MQLATSRSRAQQPSACKPRAHESMLFPLRAMSAWCPHYAPWARVVRHHAPWARIVPIARHGHV